MRARSRLPRVVLSATFPAIAALLALSCGDSGGGGNPKCTPGAQGCACASGACNAGLACVAGKCEGPDGGGTGAATGAGGAAASGGAGAGAAGAATGGAAPGSGGGNTVFHCDGVPAARQLSPGGCYDACEYAGGNPPFYDATGVCPAFGWKCNPLLYCSPDVHCSSDDICATSAGPGWLCGPAGPFEGFCLLTCKADSDCPPPSTAGTPYKCLSLSDGRTACRF